MWWIILVLLLLRTPSGVLGLEFEEARHLILLEQPRLAVHLTEKLWRAFISDTPDAAEVQRLAALFRQHDYALKPLLQALFMSSHFRAASNRGSMVKSPVELVVGTLRLLHVPVRDPELPVRAGRALGQVDIVGFSPSQVAQGEPESFLAEILRTGVTVSARSHRPASLQRVQGTDQRARRKVE